MYIIPVTWRQNARNVVARGLSIGAFAGGVVVAPARSGAAAGTPEPAEWKMLARAEDLEFDAFAGVPSSSWSSRV